MWKNSDELFSCIRSVLNTIRAGGSLTRGTGVTAAIDIQPSRPPDREFALTTSDCKGKLLTGRIKSSFDALLKTRQVRKHMYDRKPRPTRLQTSTVKDKIESVRARLDRLRAESEGVAKDANEFRRRKDLYECVHPTLRRRIRVKSFSELSRGSRTSYDFYLNALMQTRKRRKKGTWSPYAISQMTSGMPSSNTKSVLTSQRTSRAVSSPRSQFSQQKAIYEQNSKLIVSRAVHRFESASGSNHSC